MSILSQFKQSQNTDFPNVRPSLDLRFALAKKLDPRITFTRGSTGTYFGPDGLMRTAGVNIPRFDHDPITGQSLGLLIEESRQNLVTYSADVSNAAWGKVNLNIGSTTTAPDGSSTAYKIIENATTNLHNIAQGVGTISGTYTVSCFVKAAERFRGYIQLFGGGGNATAFFNLRTGTITGGSGTITPYGNGWYRVSSTATFTSATAACYFVIFNDSGVSTYTGDSNSGIYYWGAQVEAGAFPTSYIPTTASTVTRSADLASMTGTNFSSWYNSSEGTFFTSIKSSYGFTSPANASSFGIFTSSNVLVLGSYHTLASVWLFRNSNGGNNFFSAVGATTTGVRNSIASYKAGNPEYYASVVNGGGFRNITNATYLNGNLRTDSSYFELGPLRSGLLKLNGTISRLTYYPIQLTNQQLINLTS